MTAPRGEPKWTDRRRQFWLYALVGLLGFAHQVLVAVQAQPAILTFCGFLCGSPIAAQLWGTRKDPE